MTYTKTGRIAAAVLAAIGWLGLALYLTDAAGERGRSWLGAFWQNAGYLTDLSNLLLAIVMTGIALQRPALQRPAIVGWALVAIATVGVAFWLVGGTLEIGESALEDVLLHGVTPWAALLFWLVFAPKGQLRVRDALAWLAWPVAYFVYAMARGLLTGTFAYGWMDPAKHGLASVMTIMAMVLVVYALWSVALLGTDRVLGRRRSVAG